MWLQIPIIIVLLLFVISMIEGRTFQHDVPLFFETDTCLLECGAGVPHSLCNDPPRSNTCGARFIKYNIKNKDSPFQRDIILGHNGIRNRIAERMQVGNMLKLKWDTDLENMATNWVEHCQPYQNDPCASFNPTAVSYENKDRYLYINTNSAYYLSSSLPEYLIVLLLNTWYFEKDDMEPPTITPYQDHDLIKQEHFGDIKVGYFKVHNNFTQIANADTQRVGCALSRYEHGFHFICYYYPYLKSDTFIRGKPVSQCPNLYPLPDRLFTNLCTGDGSLSLHFQNNNLINYFIIFVVFISL